MYIRGEVKRSREKKGPVKRSRAVLGQSQAVKIDFRRSRILTPVADGPTESTGVTAPCLMLSSQASYVIVSGFRAALDLDTYPFSNSIRPRCAERLNPDPVEVSQS